MVTTPRKKLAPQPLTEDTFVLRSGLGAPVVADPDRIVVSRAFEDATATLAAQPDVPRNLTITITDANTSITAGLVTVTGIDPQGRTITEVFDVTDGLTQTGVKIFAVVSSVVISGQAGSDAGVTDVITVGVGNVIGLPSPIDTAGQVKHVYLDGARVASPTVARGPSTSGVDVSGSTYNGTKELVVFYAPGY
jgi:hypothetical protein